MLFILTHEFFPRRGGIATFTEEMASAASRLGHAVEVWAQHSPHRHPEKDHGYAIRRLPLRGTHGLGCRMTLARHLISERRRLRRAKVYLCEPGPMLALMPLLAFKTFRPQNLYLTLHGSEILRFHADPGTRLQTRRLIQHATRVSVLTDYTARLLVERFPESAPKLCRTPGALRTNFRRPFDRLNRSNRNRVVILTVGRIHPRKGQTATLEALLSLPEHVRAQIEYHIAGSASRPEHAQRLRNLAAQADFPVRFLGEPSDDELFQIYANADIFALTSIEHGHSIEGFGLVYLEASAHSLPIVAHRIGGVPEAVEHGVNGLLVNPTNRQELTQTFSKLIQDPALRAQLGAAGPAWAARHTWEQSVKTLLGDPLPSKRRTSCCT